MKPAPLIVVALGSNLGPSARILGEAAQCLSGLSEHPFLRSSLWKTTPVDCPPDSPGFVNAVVGMSSPAGMTPLAFLDHLQEMERGFGRPQKTVLNEPRPLDLDIIIWGDQTLVTDRLVIPHPRAHTRRFVLQPMAEIVPNYTWPGSRHTVAELLASLDDSEVLERVPEWPSSGIP